MIPAFLNLAFANPVCRRHVTTVNAHDARRGNDRKRYSIGASTMSRCQVTNGWAGRICRVVIAQIDPFLEFETQTPQISQPFLHHR